MLARNRKINHCGWLADSKIYYVINHGKLITVGELRCDRQYLLTDMGDLDFDGLDQ
jgi:hypothetical protein